jgi:hypothetical protein
MGLFICSSRSRALYTAGRGPAVCDSEEPFRVSGPRSVAPALPVIGNDNQVLSNALVASVEVVSSRLSELPVHSQWQMGPVLGWTERSATKTLKTYHLVGII